MSKLVSLKSQNEQVLLFKNPLQQCQEGFVPQIPFLA